MTSEEGLRNLSASRLKSFRGCQRLHHYEYDLGYRPTLEAADLRFGTLFHKGLEGWWRAKQLQRDFPLEDGLDAIARAINPANRDPYEHAKAEEMLRAYDARWADQPYEVLAVETRFEMALVNPATGSSSKTWRLVGKLDSVVRDLRKDCLEVVEHKTSGEDISPGSKYWERLRMDSQVSIYFDGAVALGFKVEACLYDVAAKPGIRPSAVPIVEDGAKVVLNAAGERVRTKDGKKWRETADSSQGFVLQTRPETPDEYRLRLVQAIAADPNSYFGRAEVVRLEHELDEARFDAWQLGQQMREAERLKRYPRNPDHCERYGRLCPFFGVCTGVDSLEDATKFTRRTESKEETPCNQEQPSSN